jgi:2-iminoacetate synthase
MATTTPAFQVDENRIQLALDQAASSDAPRVREILARARELKGLPDAEVAVLMGLQDPDLLAELFQTARQVKEDIYGNRIVFFAPLYVSNLCGNECLYCAFRASNKAVVRRALDQAEIATEVRYLVRQGHKRVLLVAGEAYPKEGLDYVLRAVQTVYHTKEGPGEIRRVNVNIAPLSVPDFRRLKEANIGTFQLFQETYHRATYTAVHRAGKKADFDWRVTGMHRALEAGINDVGIGVLFGLSDWKFDLLAILQHVRSLEGAFGVGPHTISVPRIEPAVGSELAEHPPQAVSDGDFRKIVAILRLAVPYTGLILSTRESKAMRQETIALGISQVSAGSRTNPGGYDVEEKHYEDGAQFALGDHRGLDEVVRDLAEMGFVPSFCTACYRLGRTGADFMDLAKPGEIKAHCQPNAMATFMEYLQDYGSAATVAAGLKVIETTTAAMEPWLQDHTRRLVDRVRRGERDVYC